MALTFNIKIIGHGRLVVLDGNYEYLFLFCEQENEVTIGGLPARYRIYLPLLGGWHAIPANLSPAQLKQMHLWITKYFGDKGQHATVIFNRGERDFMFFPELVEYQRKALTFLGDKGFVLLRDFTSIGILHNKYGLEVCGIAEQSKTLLISELLKREFPHFYYSEIFHQDVGCEPGWKLFVYMLPNCAGDGKCL